MAVSGLLLPRPLFVHTVEFTRHVFRSVCIRHRYLP